MTSREGWVLDCHHDAASGEMLTWVFCDDGEVVEHRRAGRFELHVHGMGFRLQRLRSSLGRPEYAEVFGPLNFSVERRLLDLADVERSEVLCISVEHPNRLARLASWIATRGDWRDFSLYSVDVRPAQCHLLALGTHPTGRVRIEDGVLTGTDARLDIDWPIPALRIVELHVECRDDFASRSRRAAVSEIRLTPRPRLGMCEPAAEPVVLRPRECGGPREMLRSLERELNRLETDVIITQRGDEIDFPALVRLASALGHELRLGRSGTPLDPRRGAVTTWTYGRLWRKEAYHALEGRLHISRKGSFIFREGGLEGLLELSRLAGLSPQDLSRLSPGTAVSAMQIRQALEQGVLVPWKKNRPEDMKTGRELVLADRGGLYLQPQTGVHEHVFELDYASLFPSIIVTRNISPETLNCDCCEPVSSPEGDATRRWLPLDPSAAQEVLEQHRLGLTRLDLGVPELGYHCCTRRAGFLGKVVGPVIERRRRIKERREVAGDVHDRRQNVLKWVLVTCFGYTGYRNARFGRIECHEAICAWSRELMLQAIEAARAEGWRCLHAIVDSMWLIDERGRSLPDQRADIQRLIEKVSEQVGIALDLEDEYHWIAFLPNRTSGVGALTKYFANGHAGIKLRGIELRQHSTPKWVGDLQRAAIDLLCEDHGPAGQQAAAELLESELARLRAGEVPLSDLLTSRRVVRELSDYRVRNITRLALERAERQGRRVPPGHKVRFVVIRSDSKDDVDRIRLDNEVEAVHSADEGRHRVGDPEHYIPLALRAISAILTPFGWSEQELSLMASSRQMTLAASLRSISSSR